MHRRNTCTPIRELQLCSLLMLITHAVYTHTLYLKMAASMKLRTNDAQHTLFSLNYDVGSADGDDVDFEHPASDGSFDFQGKNDSKSSESEVVYVPTMIAICSDINNTQYVVSRL